MSSDLRTTLKTSPPSIDPIPGMDFIVGGIAACGAVTFTNPLEVVKTRLQLQGELQRQLPHGSTKVYRGVGHALVRIARVEGLQSLQRGLVPAYLYQLTVNGMRFGLYANLKHTLEQVACTIQLQSRLSSEGGQTHVLVNVLSGAAAGILSALVGSPFFLVKTRIQSYSKQMPVGTQHAYLGTWDAFRSIYQQNGIRGLFSGAPAAMIRTGVGSAIQLTTFDRTKSTLLQAGIVADNSGADFLSSLVSGFFVCVGMNPPDVVQTRMYNQPLDPVTGRGQLYRSPWDCFVKTMRAEGVAGFYKGFLAHYMRIGPHTVLCFVFMEQLKRVARGQGWM